ncbi:dihydrofolate reductase family protein [Bacillus sp. JJ1773]|uniref:RibD family protein n=1 Tax=Bacillus sp. JJ1773 TaxID=3122965 RepID=UPI002FFE375B
MQVHKNMEFVLMMDRSTSGQSSLYSKVGAVVKIREALGLGAHLKAGAAHAINKLYYHDIKTKPPYVMLKVAVPFNGEMAAKTDGSKLITSPESSLDVHQLRHEKDIILISVNTIIYDNPHLTTRLPQGGKNSIRFVLDTHLRTSLKKENII